MIALTPAPARAQPIDLPVHFDRDGSGMHLVTEVRVNGKPFRCYLDSGGGALLALDAAEAARQGLLPTSRGASAGVGGVATPDGRLDGATIAIGGVTLSDQRVILRPFEPEVPEADCLFGLPLLREYIIELDYITPRVRIHEPARFRPPDAATAIPFTMERNQPLARVTLALADGQAITANVMLDTGASYYSLVLMRRFADTHDVMTRVGPTVQRPEVEHDTPGAIRVVAARPPSLTLGSFTVQRPVIGVLTNESPFLTIDGLLGAGFFTRFDVAFDFPDQRLFLTPNAHFAERQLFDASGVGFIMSPDPGADQAAGATSSASRSDPAMRFIAATVLPESPAALAGVRKGDVLESIDGRRASGLTARQIADLLSRPGQRCTLHLRRDGRPIVVTLTLVERL